MDFKKKLKIRLYWGISCIVIGVLIIVGANVLWQDIEGLWGIGLGLIVVGVRKLRNYFLITKNEETIKKQQIAESDERFIAIAHKAASIAISVYTTASAITIITLVVMDRGTLAVPIGCSVIFLLLIYRISYFIIRMLH